MDSTHRMKARPSPERYYNKINCHMNGLTNIKLDFLPDAPEGIYLVGGTVRDLLAGHPPADIDLVVAGDMGHVAGQIAAKTGGRVIDLGKDAFNVLRVASPPGSSTSRPLPIHPSKPICCSGISQSMPWLTTSMRGAWWTAPVGRRIWCSKTVRMVSPSAFEKDPARLVRAYRMAAVLQFSIDDKTQDAIRRHRHRVGSVAGRTGLGGTDQDIRQRRFRSRHHAHGGQRAAHPDFPGAAGGHRLHSEPPPPVRRIRPQPPGLSTPGGPAAGDRRPVSRFDGAATGATDLSAHTAMLKYGALLHDVGKPATGQSTPRAGSAFPGTLQKVPTSPPESARRLRLSNRQRQVSDAIIRHHIRPLFLFLASENGSLGRRGMIRFLTAAAT
jgi:poly(A) polymerase